MVEKLSIASLNKSSLTSSDVLLERRQSKNRDNFEFRSEQRRESRQNSNGAVTAYDASIMGVLNNLTKFVPSLVIEKLVS